MKNPSLQGEISSIEFQAGSCFGECPVFTITIDSEGETFYSAGMFSPRQGLFHSVLPKIQLDRLMGLVKRAGVFQLEDAYTLEVTDHPSYQLTVELKNGQTKTIEDYGPSGPEKLQKVYRKIFPLRGSLEWD